MAEKNEPKVENNTPTQEACPDPERSEGEGTAALKVELEAEKSRFYREAETRVAEATRELTEKVATLEADLVTKTGELVAIQGQLAEATTAHSELVEEFEGAKAAYGKAVEDYKKLVLVSNPLFTPDIIGGDTIDAVKASVEKAGVLVSKVKEGLEAQASALSQLNVVPAGAPARSPINTEGLSAKEKINLGLEQARKRKE